VAHCSFVNSLPLFTPKCSLIRYFILFCARFWLFYHSFQSAPLDVLGQRLRLLGGDGSECESDDDGGDRSSGNDDKDCDDSCRGGSGEGSRFTIRHAGGVAVVVALHKARVAPGGTFAVANVSNSAHSSSFFVSPKSFFIPHLKANSFANTDYAFD
jgi:hypothetical protein